MPNRNSRPLVRELEALNLAAADLATQMTALTPSLERLMRAPGPGPLAASFSSFLAGPVTVTLTVQRFLETLAGCVMALVAALSFWPVWERDRFPPLLAGAIRANRVFLEQLCRGLAGEPGATPASVTKVKRKAQRANSLVFSSLNRMAGDPRIQREGIERSAALANHNLRITRGLSVGAVHLTPGAPPIPGLEPMARAAAAALDALAAVVEGADPASLDRPRADLEAAALPAPPDPRTAWVAAQLEQAGTELSAMLLQPQ